MKKSLSFITLIMLMLALASGCNKNSPKQVATTWLNSFYHMDYEAAKKLSTDDTRNFISLIQQFSPHLSDSEKMEMKKTVITVKDVKVEGNNAAVIYNTSEMPQKDQPLTLIKQGDKWLVEFSKSDHLDEANGNAPPQEPESDTTAPANSVDDSLPDSSGSSSKQ